MKLTIREYLTPQGRNPFRNWLKTLDVGVQPRIQARVLRFEDGNLGDHKAVGGDRASQSKDIDAAKRYWGDFRKEVKHGPTQ